jgi:hypothetical protein
MLMDNLDSIILIVFFLCVYLYLEQSLMPLRKLQSNFLKEPMEILPQYISPNHGFKLQLLMW